MVDENLLRKLEGYPDLNQELKTGPEAVRRFWPFVRGKNIVEAVTNNMRKEFLYLCRRPNFSRSGCESAIFYDPRLFSLKEKAELLRMFAWCDWDCWEPAKKYFEELKYLLGFHQIIPKSCFPVPPKQI